jgi:transglutaminase-like putative cysteine protease
MTTPSVPIEGYRDSFGNWCNRFVAPAGRFSLGTDSVIRDSGQWDISDTSAQQMLIQNLPSDALLYLLGSRYCDTDLLLDTAWALFKDTPLGFGRVQAVCDYVHSHITFGYEHGRPTRTAMQALQEGRGVCRDFAHLAIAFCRCLNIPARYCTGYISDIGLPLPHAPGDFGAWIEVFLGGRWHLFDPRNNNPRIGRILVAYGRDAADVPLTLAFGANTLTEFSVITDEIADAA